MYNTLMKSCTACGRGNLRTDTACVVCGEAFKPESISSKSPRRRPPLPAILSVLALCVLLGEVLLLRHPFTPKTEVVSQRLTETTGSPLRSDPLQQTGEPVGTMRTAALRGEWRRWGDPVAIGRTSFGRRLIYQGKDGRLVVDIGTSGKMVIR